MLVHPSVCGSLTTCCASLDDKILDDISFDEEASALELLPASLPAAAADPATDEAACEEAGKEEETAEALLISIDARSDSVSDET